MGSSNITENFAESESLFIIRDLVNEYLSTATSARRAMILKELEKYELNQPVYLSAIILNMVPPQAPQLGELYKPGEAKYTGEHPLEFEVTVKGPKAKGGKPIQFKYLVHLPPQYDPYRKYPCLMTCAAVTRSKSNLNVGRADTITSLACGVSETGKRSATAISWCRWTGNKRDKRSTNTRLESTKRS